MNNPPAPTYFTDKHAVSMELRDYFAAKAMQIFLLDKRASMQDDAIDAYKMADAMLKAREA